jgi:hypothetical protein
MTKRPVDETAVVRRVITAPYADTALCKFVTKQIAALSGLKSQREIAAEVGYDRPNIISMIKNGVTALPLDKVPAFAKALDVDPRHLFRLTLEQNHPEIARVAHEIFGNVVSDNEMAHRSQLIRYARANGGTDSMLVRSADSCHSRSNNRRAKPGNASETDDRKHSRSLFAASSNCSTASRFGECENARGLLMRSRVGARRNVGT